MTIDILKIENLNSWVCLEHDESKIRRVLNNVYCQILQSNYKKSPIWTKSGLLIAYKIREFCHNFDVSIHFLKSGQGVGSSLMKAMAKVIKFRMVIELSGVQVGLNWYAWFQIRTSGQRESQVWFQTKITTHEVQVPPSWIHFEITQFYRLKFEDLICCSRA